jgi:phosphomannomutase
MALKFGTSGVRGLVTDMTDRACYHYATAYARHLTEATAARSVAIAGDLRRSTPRIKRAVAYALQAAGLGVVDCGFVPTPAVAAYAMRRGFGSIMVTGSHIPDDRNGIKFYLPQGEALKADEEAISAYHSALVAGGAGAGDFDQNDALTVALPAPRVNREAAREYEERFVLGFPVNCLRDKHLVVYEHSAVGRDIFTRVLRRLGARVTTVGRSDTFVPVDTEAVAKPERLAAWVADHQADALLSLDGDSDRPLVVDDAGEILRGDVLGILVAMLLEADHVATPVSCNTALEKLRRFPRIVRTRIGSPYVIEGMAQAGPDARMIVGYEANGGFLTHSDRLLRGARGVISALPTRDALLPIIGVLALAAREGCAVSELRELLPPRFEQAFWLSFSQKRKRKST